jgi:hypothetical protein
MVGNKFRPTYPHTEAIVDTEELIDDEVVYNGN